MTVEERLMELTEPMDPVEPTEALDPTERTEASEHLDPKGVHAAADRLEAGLRELGSLVVAFSGGVDSTVVLAAAARALGPRVLAVIADSPSLARRELAEARELAAALGVRLVEVATDELADEGYRRNLGDRCYFCKSTVLAAARRVADAAGIAHVATGTQADDRRALDRPGLRAAEELAVVEPLVAAGIDKAMVRQLAASWALPVADKPAAPCLASRIQVGVPVSVALLGSVERAEEHVRGYLERNGLSVGDLRVRILLKSFRVEVDAPIMAVLDDDAELKRGVLSGLAALGLTGPGELAPYRSGSVAGPSSRALICRIVPCTDDLRMDVTAAAAMIDADRAAGLRPFLLVGSAGTTDTGTVDPLPALADLAAREDLWFHVDAAYGGFFRLTARGRRQLAGTERADSITLDPHKTLFLPFGTGTLVVRDPAKLYAAHEGTGNYLQEVVSAGGLPNYAHMGPELTHEIRGLRAWIPLHLHGVSAFREALDEKLDLAERVHATLADIPALEVPWRPDLSTVAFRVRPRDTSPAALEDADQATRDLLARINDDPRVLLSSTVANGRQTIRVCVVVHRTHAQHIDMLLELIAAQAKLV